MSERHSCEHDKCAAYRDLLMACFDGEADANEVAHVQVHLAACARCRRLWHTWSQSRSLLQSGPQPAPPPTLSARILAAYRWRNLSRAHGQAPAARTPVAASSDDFLSDEAAVLDATMLPAPEPPSYLRAEILRRTVGSRTGHSRTGHSRDAFFGGDEISAATVWNGGFWQNTRRALLATALPAAALGVILLAQAPPVITPAAEYSMPKPVPTHAVSLASREKTRSARHTTAPAFRPIAAPGIPAPSPRFNVPELLSPVAVPIRTTVTHYTAPARWRFTAIPALPTSPPERKTAVKPVPERATKDGNRANKAWGTPARRSQDSAPLVTPASWEPPETNRFAAPVAPASTSVSRLPAAHQDDLAQPLVSTPLRVAMRTSPNATRVATVAAEDSDVLNFVNRARDRRPDDVREAMEEFRAVLINSSWEDDAS